MKITVLIDNNALNGRRYAGEAGFCALVEEEEKRFLLDSGCSDLAVKNAGMLGVDLTRLDAVILSHGHYDHTWGLRFLPESRRSDGGQTRLIAHPAALLPKYINGEPFGVLPETLLRYEVQESREPLWLTSRLVFLGEIPRVFGFEEGRCLGTVDAHGGQIPDPLLDDTALAWRGEDGTAVMAGCSHSGICNIVRHALAVTGKDRILDILGGFHLQKVSGEILSKTGAYLRERGATAVHACHCTDLAAKIGLSAWIGVQEVGAGLTLCFGEEQENI